MILSYDISNFIQWFLSSLISIIGQSLNIMKSIEFMGTNLLQVTIVITILNLILPVLVAYAKSRRNRD